MKFSEAIINRFSKIDKKSYMIACYPDSKSLNEIIKFQKSLKLDAEKVLGPEEIHCTLRYWLQKDSPDIKKVHDWMTNEINNSDTPIVCNITDIGMLGDDALVIHLKSKELSTLQSRVDKGVQSLGIGPSDFPNFKAHVSLAYGFKGTVPKSISMDTITLDKIKLVDNDDKELWLGKI